MMFRESCLDILLVSSSRVHAMQTLRLTMIQLELMMNMTKMTTSKYTSMYARVRATHVARSELHEDVASTSTPTLNSL